MPDPFDLPFGEINFDTHALIRDIYRHEKSLGLLTEKFVDMLKGAPDGEINLHEAVKLLAIKQKRRIYDITNVLEGVGLIDKRGKNYISWRGGNEETNSPEVKKRLDNLKMELEYLYRLEAQLEDHRQKLQKNIRFVQDELENRRYAHISHDDAMRAYDDCTLLFIKAPNSARLEVPIPEDPSIDRPCLPYPMLQQSKRKFQVRIQSTTTPIEVLVVNENDMSSMPQVSTLGGNSGSRYMNDPSVDRDSPETSILRIEPPASEKDFHNALSSDEGLLALFQLM